MGIRYDLLVVTHHSSKSLDACLRAVSKLAPPPAEVLIVDNASKDDSREITRDLGFPLLEMDMNTGFTGGMNIGLKRTGSPWILVLNPDCALRPDFVARLEEGVHRVEDPDVVGSATGLLMRSEDADLGPSDIVDSAGMIVTPSGRHFDRGAGERLRDDFLRSAWVFGGTGAATLYRREALEDVAYPDGSVFAPNFFAYREDAELAWRLQWRGWNCLYEPSARGVHGRMLRPEMGRKQESMINRLSVRNRFFLRLHCADIGWHIRCFPDWLIRDLLVVGACLSIEWASLPGLGEVVRGLPEAIRRRRWVLGRRKVSSRQMARWFRRPRGWTEEIVSP